jgi:ribosomal small subunit protein bTHX
MYILCRKNDCMLFINQLGSAEKLRRMFMGKGDRRSFRGKLFRGTHGKTRPRKAKKTIEAKQ